MVHSLALLSLAGTCALAALLLAAGPASAETRTFTNSAPIAIPAGGTQGSASPYPSSVGVSGMPGPVTDVNVTLHRVGHTFPRNIGVLLVSPSGDSVMVMRLNCEPEDIEDFTWIFDQQATVAMPETGRCDEFVYRPNPIAPPAPVVLEWPAPAPPAPHGASLSDFNNEQANGTWRLYVVDFFEDNTGDIEGGWSLTITTGPADTVIPGTGGSGPANPYPATRTISGLTAVITDVNVAITGIWHQRPDDLDLLLVGPGGQKVVLMSDACGTFEVAAFAWRWDDEAAASMPDGDGTNVCATTNHRPTDYEPGDTWAAPAPAGPYAAALSAFDLTDPNGEWRLFVMDDATGEVGFFTNRFVLGVTTRPKASVTFTESAVAVAEGATRALTLRRSGPAVLGAGAVTVTSLPASATSGSDFTPFSATVQFAPDETEKTVPVSALGDAVEEPDETFVVALSSPTGDASTGTPSSVTVTIPGSPPPPARPPAPGPPSGDGAANAAPLLTGLTLNPRRFAARRRGGAIVSRKSQRVTGVRYLLSQDATVSFRVARRVLGRTVQGKCRKATRRNRTGTKCHRLLRGSFQHLGKRGPNSFHFTGRLRGRRLRPGSYYLLATATDPSGGKSNRDRVAFRIVKPR